jgi:hypothetical protein
MLTYPGYNGMQLKMQLSKKYLKYMPAITEEGYQKTKGLLLCISEYLILVIPSQSDYLRPLIQ